MRLAALALSVLSALPANAQDADLRAQYFRDAKRATLADGRQGVNCCGEGDAVKVRFIASDRENGVIFAEIIDTMKSVNGKAGDILRIPVGTVTVGLYSPFDEPIAFINGVNEPYCLSGPEGG